LIVCNIYICAEAMIHMSLYPEYIGQTLHMLDGN